MFLYVFDNFALFSAEKRLYPVIRWRDGCEAGEDKPLFRPIREGGIVSYAVAETWTLSVQAFCNTAAYTSNSDQTLCGPMRCQRSFQSFPHVSRSGGHRLTR